MTRSTTAPTGIATGSIRRVVIAGVLDDTWIDVLDAAVSVALLEAAERLELDLTAVTRWTPEAAAAISRCLDAAQAALPRGVGVTVASAAGRAALLAALVRPVDE